MTFSFVKDVIDSYGFYNLIVLKGFSPSIISELGRYYPLLDDYVIDNGVINLDNINANRLLLSILGMPVDETAICTCESFINFCSNFVSLDFLNKKIGVLENNWLSHYPNPTSCNILDYDSDEFQDVETDTPVYGLFYSDCQICNGVAKIQYINNVPTDATCVTQLFLTEPRPISVCSFIEENKAIPLLSSKDGSVFYYLNELYDTMQVGVYSFEVLAEELEDEYIQTFVTAAIKLGYNINIYQRPEFRPLTLRSEFLDILKSVWGYETFRNLKIYRDPGISTDIVEVPQNMIIETVVSQAENAILSNEEPIRNVLLTSPTGAGKSLLFQLSAIYLAQKYSTLSIVVSPLVSLMNDQVDGLRNYNGAAALDSTKSARVKQEILDGISNGTINLLYLSPELLLSYSITTFLRGRRLGLFVVDEAHTVTTWGRDFRVDYWFLGDYLRRVKRILNYKFPIFALTATAVWDPAGNNDMIFDTIRTLNMDPCIKYVGVVRRDNITFEIQQSGITNNYEEKRRKLTIQRIKEALMQGRKTIVYFPFRKSVEDIYKGKEVEDIRHKLAKYHAWLTPQEKLRYAQDFKDGKCPIICATKAFGMGIDVPDIQEVYHHAPTGCLSDYVQEIGRLARNPEITGIAKIDFSEYDFRYIRRLHGLSAIKQYQLMQVIQKLMAIYRLNGEKRNMLVSPTDFAYIFPKATVGTEVDKNLKSCLLLISNDLLNKLRFNALIVRPKSLFTKCFVEVLANEAKDFHKLNLNYLNKLTNNVFVLNADKLWNDKFNSISFPQFKYKLAEGKIFPGFNLKLKYRIQIVLNESVASVRTSIDKFFQYSHEFLEYMSSTHHRLSFADIAKRLPQSLSKTERIRFIDTFNIIYATNRGLGGETVAYCRVYASKDGKEEAFQLMQSGYENIANLYKNAYDTLIQSMKICKYVDKDATILKLGEFLNSLGFADFQCAGGDSPAIFIRINNPYYLNNLIRIGKYENAILKGIYEKYSRSEKIFTYFFTTEMSNSKRWDFIEAYFMGASEELLLNFSKHDA